MSCSVCYERGYYIVILGEEQETVRCDCQIKDEERDGSL